MGNLVVTTPEKFTDTGAPLKERYYDDGNGAYAEGVGFSQKLAGEDLVNDRQLVRSPSNYVNITASALIKTGAGILKKIVINSHTSGTLKLWDNTSAATTVLHETMSFAVGERSIDIPDGQFNTGLYATVGGTANLTLYFE